MLRGVPAIDMWGAVTRRDARADGRFVYAVRTTGVFCRPSCASRLPLRPHVEFFARSADAAAAGYRPCRRCRPDGEDPRRRRVQAIVAACRALEGEAAPRTQELARAAGLSRFHFARLFRRHTGVTPQEYRRRVLAERGRAALARAATMAEAAYAAGYSSSSRFYEGVGRELGMPPRQARAGAPGQAVRYATRACALGRVLVAWTERGVCRVALGDTDPALVAELCARFPQAAPARGRQVPAWVAAIVGAADRPVAIDVPLDIQGTAFQQRVWRELRRIPPGQTRSYAQVAAAIGRPSATRAVAAACGDNPVALVVPCHRVVRADGGLAGFRWGLARKRALLRRERR